MAKTDWRCGAARDLPINMTRSWDGGAAAKRMLDAAGIGGDHPKPEIAKRGFLLYDAGNPNLRGSYKLPFADRIEGRLTAIAAGVRNAASRLPQTDAPERERDRARQIIDHYEKRMAEEEKKNGSEEGRSAGFRPRGAHQLHFLSQRIFNTPLAIHPAKAGVIATVLARRLGIGSLRGAGVGATEFMAFDQEDERDAAREQPHGYRVQEGVAIVPIQGTLTHKLGSVQPFSGMTGYDGIRHNVALAIADPEVKGIALEIDSPGGEVSGCFDLADWLFAVRGRKPMWAIVDDSAYSAAYAIASAADWIVVPQLGGVGSVGVIALVTDLSKALEAGGITVNVIQFGARKADGLEVMPLSPEARDRFQADVNTMGDRFVDVVARNRNLDAAKVKATEAATYLGADGVRQGLADAVAAPDAAFRDFLKTLQQ